MCIGCYDGHVFTLRCDSGDSYWCIKPGGSPEPVKSSPCTDPVTGLIWLGSHDHHIYALDIYVSTNINNSMIVSIQNLNSLKTMLEISVSYFN